MKIIPFCLLLFGVLGRATVPVAWAAEPTGNAPVNPVPLAVVTNAASAVPVGVAATNPPSRTNPVAVATAPGQTEAAKGLITDHEIRFQFDGMPYTEVIKRFAQMVNKPLMGDMSVDGTLTFSDPRPYNYREAMEMLNLVLSMKGVMLVEFDRYLRLVPLKDLPQMPFRIFRGLDQTGDVHPGEVVTVVLKLKNLESSEITSAITSMLSNAGSVAPLSRGQGIIITDRLANIKRIQNLLTEVDTASPVQRQMKTYTLFNASGALVADLINKTFGIATAPKRVEFNQQTKQYQQLPPDPSDYVTAVFDEASRTLVLYGPGERLTLAESLIKRFEDQSGAKASEIRIFYPQSTSAMELARMIRQAVPGVAGENEPPAAMATKARLVVDPVTNRLIVTAPLAGQLDAIDDLVKKIDTGDGTTGAARFQDTQVSKVIRCRTADPETLVRVLTEAFSRPALPPAAFDNPSYRSGFRFRARMNPALRVTLDPKTQNIILVGSPGDVQQAADIVKQLDADEPEKRTLKVFALKTSRANDFATRVRQLYMDQIRGEPGAGATSALIIGDDVGKRLIVTATEAHLKLIEDLITQLGAGADSTTRQLKTLTLQHASATALANIITQWFNRPGRQEDPNYRVFATSSPDDQTVILDATEPTLTRIEEVVRAFDTTPGGSAFEVRTYHLTDVSAAELAQTLSRFFAQRQDPRIRNPDAVQQKVQPRFDADYTSNTLMVAATRDQFDYIEQMIKELRASAQVSQVIRMIPWQTGDPNTLIRTVTEALTKPGYRGALLPQLKITPDNRTRKFILIGTPEDVQRATEIIAQLDSVQPEHRILRMFTVKSDRSAEFAAKVQQLYQDQIRNQPGAGTADALIMGDAYGNRLIVTATEAHLKLIEGLVTELDTTATGSTRQLKTVQLKHTSANAIASMISQLFNRQNRNDDPNLRVYVTASPDDTAVMVEAAALVMGKIEEVIKQLDVEPEHGAYEVRTYHLAGANVDELSQRLARLFAERQDRRRAADTAQPPPPRFEADVTSSSLIVVATKDQLPQIEDLIKELRATFEVATEVRVFKLENSTADQMAQLLESLLSEDGQTRQNRPYWYGYYRPGAVNDINKLRVMAAPNLNAVVVQGPPQKLSQAEQLIRSLDKPDTDFTTTLQAVHLSKGTAETVAEAVNKTLAARVGANRPKRVSVTPVVNSNSILIDGPSGEVKEVLQIIQDLDKEGSSGNIEIHIYKLENGRAKELSQVLRDIIRGIPRRRPTADSAYPEPRVTVTEDDRSNSLIVSAPSDMFKFIDQVLPTLDKAPERTNRNLNYFWLANADAYDVADKIDALYQNRPRADRPSVEADYINNAVTVVANKADLKEIEEMIQRLDETAVNTTMQVRLIPLDKMPAAQAATMLRNIYSQMSSNEVRIVDRLPPRSKEKPSFKTDLSPSTSSTEGTTNQTAAAATGRKRPAVEPPPVIIAVDQAANSLIVSGPARELDEIQTIIRQLSYSAASNDAELRLFPLQEADPVGVARTLNELFRQEQVQLVPGATTPRRRAQRQGEPPAQPVVAGQPPRISVVAEPRTRSVIIRAKPTDFILLESLIKQLDVAGLSSQLAFRLVPAQNVHAEKLLPLVSHMITELNLARPGEPVAVLKDPRGDALFLIARKPLLDQLEAMIHQLDTPSTFAEADVEMIALKNARAPQLASVLQDMLKPGAKGETTPEAVELQEQVRRLKIRNDHGDPILLDLTKPIRVMADTPAGAPTGSNRLILTSTPDNLKALGAIVAMMDTVPLMEGISAKLVHLKHADAATAAQTLNAIFFQGQRIFPGGGGGPGQGGGRGFGRGVNSPLNVAVDRQSNTLILSGQEETLALAQNIIDQLDREIESMVTVVKLFRLKYASATQLAPLLQSVFAEGRSVAGSDGLRAQVTRLQTVLGKLPPKTSAQPQNRAAVVIEPDNTTSTLIVAARSDMMPLIEDVIGTLDIPEASGLANIRIYPLQHADAATVQRLLTDLYRGGGGRQFRRQDLPNVTIDERTNALIVSGNETAFAIVSSLIERLDKELPPEFRNVQIIPLENADAMSVAASLQRLLDTRLNQRSGAGRQEGEVLRTVIIADPRTNSLLVGGPKEGYELVRTLALELDKTNPSLNGQIRLVPLKFAAAQTLSSALTTLFSQRAQAARAADQQRIRPVIVPDPRSNSLLIAASVEDSRAIDGLLEKLDRVPENPAVSLTVLGLRHNDSDKVATMLMNVFNARHQSLAAPGQQPVPQDQVHFEADPLTNSLIVSANAENLALIKELLAKIDVEPVSAGGLIQTFTLKQADAQRAANILSSLVAQGLYRPGITTGAGRTGREVIAVTVDERSNTLIVSASPENMLVVKELLHQLDSQANADAGDIQLFSLKYARASQLSTVLQQFFTSKRAAESTAGRGQQSVPVTVTPDDRTNTLLVTGGKDTFAAIQRMIAQLDAKDILSKTLFQVFLLKQATAGKLQATLIQLFTRRPTIIKGQPPEPITVVADSWANAVVVGAAPEDMPMVQSLIEQLDSDHTAAGTEVQVIPLAKADVRRVAQTLTTLFSSGGPGSASPVTVNADERVNAIVVSAGQADLKRIEELVKKLDTDQVANVSEIRIFSLVNARATQLSAMLTSILNSKPTPLTDQSPSRQSLLQFITRLEGGKELLTSALKEGILITPDPRSNSLIVSAPVDYMNLLEQLIKRLDNAPPQMAKLRVFNLKNADVRQMSTILQNVFRLQRTGTQVPSERAVQYTLVRSPGAAGLGKDKEPGATATVGTGTDDDNALTINVDVRTQSLIVGGTEHYVQLVGQLIESLDASPGQERVAQVYPLKNTRATDIQTALQTFNKQDQTLITAAFGQQAMAQELLDQEISIVAETNSNSLLISGSPRYLMQVTNIIAQLDQPQLQVLIQVLLAEVTLDSQDDLGVEWTYQSGGNPSSKTGTDFGVPNDLKKSGGFSSAISGNNFNFLIRALQSEDRLQVLSRPQIVAANNQPAQIKVTQQVPLITSSQTIGLTGNVQNQISYQDVGVILQVTPRISPDGFVKLDIQTTNSQLSAQTITINPGVTAPIINQRSASTTISVQSGQSILIGGLISTTDETTIKRFPILGKIPYLGALFRSTSKTKNRTELLALLTPQVLHQPTEPGTFRNADAVTRDQIKKSTISNTFDKNDILERRLLENLEQEKKAEPANPKPADKPAPKNP